MTRKILHFDLDAFFCACEELDDPALHGTVFAVGGPAENRGVISTCSYAARALGIHSGMPTAQAFRICPTLNLISGRHHHYGDRSRAVMAILANYTPLMQQISVDEAFLDVSDLPQTTEELAHMIQDDVISHTGLSCSLGGAVNKLVAKMANTMGKKRVKTLTYPRSILCIPEGEEAAFLAPLPIGKMWGIGESTEKHLRGMGITTIGQLAAYPPEHLTRIFGKNAWDAVERAKGIDPSPVHPDHDPAKSVSQEYTFEKDVSDRERLRQVVFSQSEQVGYRLRRDGLKGNTVRLKLRRGDFSTITRQTRPAQPVYRDDDIYAEALKLLDAALREDDRPVRLIGVGVSGFEEDPQPSLFDSDDTRKDKLQEAIDAIRVRYGKDALTRGKVKTPRDPEN